MRLKSDSQLINHQFAFSRHHKQGVPMNFQKPNDDATQGGSKEHILADAIEKTLREGDSSQGPAAAAMDDARERNSSLELTHSVVTDFVLGLGRRKFPHPAFQAILRTDSSRIAKLLLNDTVAKQKLLDLWSERQGVDG